MEYLDQTYSFLIHIDELLYITANKISANVTFTKMVVTMTVLFSIPVVSFAKTSDLVTAILSTSFQYPICGKEEQNPRRD